MCIVLRLHPQLKQNLLDEVNKLCQEFFGLQLGHQLYQKVDRDQQGLGLVEIHWGEECLEELRHYVQ